MSLSAPERLALLAEIEELCVALRELGWNVLRVMTSDDDDDGFCVSIDLAHRGDSALPEIL